MTCKNHCYHPCNTANYIVISELLFIHPNNTGNNRGKGSDEGKKPCKHYCTAATQLIMSQLYPYIFSGEKTAGAFVATCVAQ